MVWLKKSRALGKQDKKNLFKKSWDTLLTSQQKCGIMNTVKRERRRAARVMVYLRGCQNHKRKIKCRKPLDTPTNLWYNKYVSERESSPLQSLAATKRRENLVAKHFQKEVDTMTTRKPTKRDNFNALLAIPAVAEDAEPELRTPYDVVLCKVSAMSAVMINFFIRLHRVLRQAGIFLSGLS